MDIFTPKVTIVKKLQSAIRDMPTGLSSKELSIKVGEKLNNVTASLYKLQKQGVITRKKEMRGYDEDGNQKEMWYYYPTTVQ